MSAFWQKIQPSCCMKHEHGSTHVPERRRMALRSYGGAARLGLADSRGRKPVPDRRTLRFRL